MKRGAFLLLLLVVLAACSQEGEAEGNPSEGTEKANEESGYTHVIVEEVK